MKAHRTLHYLARPHLIVNPPLECVDMVELLNGSPQLLGNILQLEYCILPNLELDICDCILTDEAVDSDLYLTEL